MKHILYVVEIQVSGDPLRYELLMALDESHSGRPLVWAERADAEAYADGLARDAVREAPGFELDYVVVPLTGTTESENEPESGFPVPVLSRGSDDCANC